MADKYNPQAIEKKWRDYWAKNNLIKASMNTKKGKYYCLDMFPYPSGEGLHVGHWRGYVQSDIWSRYQLMQGKQVLHPMGWDAFGLPAENRAIKHGIHPQESNKQAIPNMKRQLAEIGALYDWDREIDTSSPEYYKWTQWLFLLLYKNGLAYRQEAEVNWCPQDKTVLANEQVINGLCERCGSSVTKKSLKQWFFKITDYADELLNYDGVDWPQRVKTMQRNWIGKSEGVSLNFPVKDYNLKIEIFTTRPDTIFGATFLALAPEHPLVDTITTSAQVMAVKNYQETARKKTEIERTATDKEKTGVFTGAFASNPFTKQAIPIWIADYVLHTYGTGAIMSVPAHDERDYEFALKYDLPIVQVIVNENQTLPIVDNGTLIHSQDFDGLTVVEASRAVTEEALKRGIGKAATTYRLHDWLISRQRYWGCPIPIIYCDEHGEVPVPLDQLPVTLPHQADFQPGGDSPLARNDNFVQTICPHCGKAAKRETDTMDTFVDSSWYFLRFTDPHNDQAAFASEKTNYWMPVDQYVGGIEHAILHLLYARFITKALADAGIINFREPFKRLFNVGMIYLHGKKMSKSKGNIVNPDELVAKYGADTLRGYEMFIAPADQDAEWNPNSIAGVYRFLQRAWELINASHTQKTELLPLTHRLIKKTTDELERFSFNTVVSGLMTYLNKAEKLDLSKADKEAFLKLLSPIFPHFAEEVWQMLGNKSTIFRSSWPKYDEELLKESMANFIVQINGKVKGTVIAASNSSEQQVLEVAMANPKLKSLLNIKNAQKIVFVPGRLVNFVI